MSETNGANQKETASKARVRAVTNNEPNHKVAALGRIGLATAWGNGQSPIGSVLQRTCSCGRHTIGGDECAGCRKTQAGGTAWQEDSLAQGGERAAAAAYTPAPQPQQRDFSQVKATSRIAQVLAGGEGGNDDDPGLLIGGERGRYPVGVSQRPGQGLQRENGGGSSAFLTHTTVTAPTNLGCGGFRDQVRWGLSGGDGANGFVVQKVTFDLQREKCDGSGDSNLQTTYWEAWEVRNGSIFIGTSTSAHNADTFQVPSAPEHRGSCYEAGWAKFIPDYEAPRSWGNVPQARALPSTTSEPVGWSNSGTINRFMRNTFDCCNQSDMGQFESGGQSNG